MRDWDNSITNYWLKYYLGEKSGLCILCGNTGLINTEKVRNPNGRLLKPEQTAYCICPNGQSLRKSNG